MSALAITGATGAIGGGVLHALAAHAPIAVVRDASRAPEGFDVRVATYADEAACERAFAGVEVLLMVSAAESATRRQEHRSCIAAAAHAGVRHIVYTSFAGAAPDATFTLGRDHFDAEQAIAASGMTSTILRDDFYLDVLPEFADAEGVIRGPAGTGRVAAVARADVVDVAAAVLRETSAHEGRILTLTGAEALTLDEVAERAGRVLGRTLRFEDETVEAAYAWRSERYGAAAWQLDAWVSTYTAIADGSVAAVTDDVELVLGRRPRTLEEALAPRG